MGLVYVDMEVYREAAPHQSVRFLIDSGAFYSVLPWDVWHDLGLEPKRSMDFSLADGTIIQRQLSECRFRFEKFDEGSPVVLGQREDAALLGCLTLEIFGLMLNPFERTLRPMRLMLASCA
jgi:predicted aspartyl protease